jgi:hypothetical protein
MTATLPTPKIMKTPEKFIPKVLFCLSVLFLLTCCKKGDEKLALKTTSLNLTSSMTRQLVVTPDASGCEFVSDNEFIATVSSTGLITAHLIGETNITVTNSAEGFSGICNVTVQPVHALFRVPYLEFEKKKMEIKDYETRFLYEESDTSLFYSGENSTIIGLIYFLYESLYYESTCLISADNPDSFEDFIAERYYLLESDDEFSILMTPDGKTLVGIESGIMIGTETFYAMYYIAYPTSKSGDFVRLKPEIIKMMVPVK